MSQVNPDARRLAESLERSAAIGSFEGGLRRLSLSPADREMRAEFVRWADADGYEVRTDVIGNMFVGRPGTDASLDPVVVGSHLDTQDPGGRFDGVLGVLAGLEVLRTLDDHELTTTRDVVVANWLNEEGARFQPAMLGSSVAVGMLDLAAALGSTDRDGQTLEAALAEAGAAGSEPIPLRRPHAYLELHIEQGPLLDEAGIDVGFVDRGWPVHVLAFEFRGETSHAGPPPMERRRDALAAAARVIAAADEMARALPDARATASRLEISPNRTGLVSDHVSVLIDLRHRDSGELDRMDEQLRGAAQSIAESARVDLDIRETWRFGGVVFDDALVRLGHDTAARRGIAAQTMPSIAGHDAYQLAQHCRAELIFTPCIGGITHHPREDIELERTMPGVQVLTDMVLTEAGAIQGGHTR